jgi:hypothetical protein
MAKQNNNTETVEIRFVVTGRPDETKILTAKWMRSNKTEVLEFLAQAKKTEIIADNGATPNRVHWAKIESAAFFKYLAEALSAQIAADTRVLPGDYGQGTPQGRSPRVQTPQISSKPKEFLENDDYDIPPPNPDDEPGYEIDL